MVNHTKMSADDFQTKYASVMDSMLKSAIAETTKLFETMVDELKAEITRIKKENEDLKTRCSRFESASGQPAVHTRESESLPGRSDGSEKRDTAVQCDLVPFCTMIVEQCQPLRHSSSQSQKQQCGHEEMEYHLQEHNYTHGDENSEMEIILVKQENEVESSVVCRQVLSDKGGPFINKVCSTGEIPSHQRHEETQVALELPISGTYSGLQGAQNQSSEPEHSLVISRSAITDDIEIESEASQKISEAGLQGELKASEKHQLVVAQPHEPPEEQPLMVPRQCQRDNETSVNEQTDVRLQQNADTQSTQEQFAQTTPLNSREICDKLKNGMAEVEGSYQPELSIRRRGRQPKPAKRLQQPVKEILQSSSSDIPAEQEVKKIPAMRVEEVEVSSAVDTVHITSFESPPVCPVQPKEPNPALEDVEKSKVGSLLVSVPSLSKGCSSEKESPRESQQLSMVIEEGAIRAPSSAESPQTPSFQPEDTPVTLQDAMLFVEAMNQSMVENTFSSPQRMAAPSQAQCVSLVGALQTVDKVPAEPSLPVETHEAIGSLPITELSTKKQSTKEGLTAPPQTRGTTPTNETQAHIKVVIQKQQHAVSLSNTTTSSVPPSNAAVQTSVQSLHQHRPLSLTTSVAPSRQGKTVPHKIIVVPRSVSSLMPHKLAAQSPTQTPAVVSAVVAAQNNNVLPCSTAAGLPLRTPGLHPEKTIIIPRQVSAVPSRKHQLHTVVPTAQQESARSSPVMVSSSQLISSSQQLSVSVDTHMASNEVATILPQNVDNTPDNLESPKQTASASETINAQTETSSSLNMSVELVPPSKSPAVPLTFVQKLSAVVRLSRLPFPISTKDSVFVSRLPPNGSSDSQSILKEGTTQEQSCVVISTQPSETLVLPTDIRSNLKETSLAVSANTSQMSEEPNVIEEKVSVFAENCIPLEESSNSGHVQPSTSSKVSQPVFEKSAVAGPSAVSGTPGEHTFNLDEEISIALQDGVLPNGRPIGEKQSAALIHPTSIMTKDTSNPHLQMLKTQFLAQLAVSPVQVPKKAPCNDSIDTRASCAGPSISDKTELQKKSLLAQLRSHIKMHLQARRSETNPEPHTETETCSVSPKKCRLENDHPIDKNTTSEPALLSPKNPGALEDVTSLKKTTNEPASINHRTSGLCIDGVKPKMTVNESSVSCRTSKAKNESTSVRPGRSASTTESATCERTKNTRPRRTISTRHSASSKNSKTADSPNNTKTSYVRPKRTSSSRDGVSPKKTKYTSVSLRTSSLSKNSTSPKISTNESTSVNHRRCTFTKDGSTTKQIKREFNSVSPRKCSTTTDGTSTKNKSETDSQSVRWPKLPKDGVSPRKSGKSTSVKTPRLLQDGISPESKVRVVNAKKLAQAAKAKTIPKMRNSQQSKLLNGAKTSQLAENSPSCNAVKKCTPKAVWTPPRMPIDKTLPAGGKMSVHLPVKKETRSQDHTVVYPPSVSLHPIPVKAPPVVSPLQPLSVIGRRLLKNQCGECGRVLSSSVALESHVSLHKGRRPFSCTLCGKGFPDSKGLKRHGRVHRNGRIHICQKCGKGFVYRFCLTKHLQMVHSRIKPFVCQMCDKGFFTKRDVEAHIRIHTGEKPFHCNLCEKKFARRVELNVHLRWHNGEKRHWCPYCGKGFLDFNNLKRHKYIHTGEKPHSCPYCPKNFTQSGHLKKHVKNVHKIQ
ncbi:uncharacterized protein LOC121603867 isoform X2 [Chelmon rostratus]|uniref:uncharacterized protein LOC121603867 isoform X2 n=1 Tax=Chelmon rostratus TaxID=109905 RepID=UPI001BE78DE6|nr:uncharacterized protein LOC121603867 isoform X2 [Chelmon rostratus]